LPNQDIEIKKYDIWARTHRIIKFIVKMDHLLISTIMQVEMWSHKRCLLKNRISPAK